MIFLNWWKRNWGTWVVLPLPVSPQMTVTWFCATVLMMISLYWWIGNNEVVLLLLSYSLIMLIIKNIASSFVGFKFILDIETIYEDAALFWLRKDLFQVVVCDDLLLEVLHYLSSFLLTIFIATHYAIK